MEIFWDKISQQDWEGLANRAGAPLPQRWTYGAVHAALGGQVFRAVVVNNGKPVALCQCLCRRVAGILNLSLATRGPLWLTDCDQRLVMAMIRRTIPSPHPRMRVFTLPAASPKHLIPLMTPASVALVTLPMSRKNLSGSWRNALKKAEKSDLVIDQSFCDQSTLEHLLLTDAAQQASKNYTALPAAFTQRWQALATNDTRFYTAKKSGKTIAAALFLCHGNTATYHIAYSTPEGRKVSAARLILWRAFQDFATTGVTRVDLGTLNTETAPGLARFKLGSGAQAHRLGPTILA